MNSIGKGHDEHSGLTLLANRISVPALTLKAPGPNSDQLAELLDLAVRVPDHGRLTPWRFVILEGEAKAAFADRLEERAAEQPDAGKAKSSIAKIRRPPLCVAVVSRVTESKIPEWEQVLSAGAVCMNLLLAATGFGFGANWITGWHVYDADCQRILGLSEGERVAGYVLIGTKTVDPMKRERPAVSALVEHWVPR